MKELIEQINALCDAIKVDIVKTEKQGRPDTCTQGNSQS